MPDYHSNGYDDQTDAELLAKVTKGWQCKETPCGTGSMVVSTQAIRGHLPNIVFNYGIKTVVDAGAGDLNWMPLVDWDVDYKGFDLYPRHPDVQQFDMCKEVLPKSDLIICRHVLNHLSIKKSEQAVENFRKSGSTYLLMTMCDNQVNYWKQYGFSLGSGKLQTFTDVDKWWLELWRL